DIGRIGDLRYVREDGGSVAIGALATHHDVLTNDVIAKQAPLLADTARHIADPQVRNRGTLGGSLAHADPAADYPATILALDAEVVAQGPNGRRTIKATELFTGMLTTALRDGRIAVGITGAGSVPTRATAVEQALGSSPNAETIAKAAEMADQGI